MATPYDAVFAKYAAISGVPQAVIEAVARTESSLRPSIITPESRGRYSYGLFQILDETAKRYGVHDFNRLLEPDYATQIASRIMEDIIERQGGLNLTTFYSEYNSGRGDRWQTNESVFEHVQNFLSNYMKSVSTTDVGSILLLVAVGLLIQFFRRKK